MTTTTKRSVMTLHSGALDIYSHMVRIVLAEKAVSVDILHVDADNPPEALLELNPYTVVPTLTDRDLVLYRAPIIMEYLDERFPHPPLLPVYPIARAKYRLMMHHIERDCFSLISKIRKGSKHECDEARKSLREQLIQLIPVFSEMPYFLSEEFSLVDCYLGPLLWRLSSYQIDLPKNAKPINEYSKRVFERPSFQASLSDLELELRRNDDT